MASQILLLCAPKEQAWQYDEVLTQLSAHSFSTKLCHDLSNLSKTLQETVAKANTNVMALLAGDPAENGPAARYLRALRPDSAIVSLCFTDSDSESIALLQAGVDFILPAKASTELIVAALLSVLRRSLAIPVQEQQAEHVDKERRWVLKERGWRLVSPNGLALNLTTTEREFFKLMLANPAGLQVERLAMARVIEERTGPASAESFDARIAVLIARLRRKVVEQLETELPLKSVYRVGYMFTEELREEA